MDQDAKISAFIDDLTAYDGYPPLSDAKIPIDPRSGRSVIIADGDVVEGIGAAAMHPQPDGTIHSSLETAVRPLMRFPAFEEAVLEASLPMIEGFDSSSVWSNRPSLDAALQARGMVADRILDFLAVSLPLDATPVGYRDVTVRPFVDDDLDAVIATNRAAFAGHREAASLDRAEMLRIQAEPWFDADGLLIADEDGHAGFCWTRIHPNGDGEIFRIAVAPGSQGAGVGAVLLRAGFEHLAADPRVHRGVLWVDHSNRKAMGLYESIGMAKARSISEFTVS